MEDAGDRKDRLLVIIPAWNEGAVIGAVLDEVRAKVPWVDILVVSDGSTDDTVLQARERSIPYLDLPLNLGVGGAMRAGFLYARRSGYDWAVQLDADGQHDPAEIPAMLEAAVAENADIVVGARFAGRGDYRSRGPRKWAMRVLSLVLSPVAGTKLTDTTSGYKLYSRRAINLFAADYPAEYLGDTIGGLTLGAREGLKIVQVPAAMRPRMGGEPSHGAWRATLFLMRAWLALAVSLTRRKRPRPAGEDDG